MDNSKREKAQKKVLRPVKTMPQNSNKLLADEEVARRLHEELNGPEASSPVAAATRRNRRAPSFYSPAEPGALAVPDGSGQDEEGAFEQSAAALEPPIQPGSGADQRTNHQHVAVSHERPTSSTKRPGKRSSGPIDMPDNHSQASPKAKPKTSEPNSRPPVTRSCFSDEASQQVIERRPSLCGPKTLAETKSDDLAALKAAPSSRGDSTIGGFGSSMASSSHASDQDQDASLSKPPRRRSLPKVPRMPMCRHGQMWYRARRVEETASKVLLEFPGIGSLQPIWLSRDSPRIWTGSYKGKDWRHLGDGAWEPKPKEESAVKKPSSASRGRKRRANAAVSSSNEELSEGEAAGEKERSKPESMPRSESQPSGIKEELGIAQQPAANSEKGVRAKPKQPADAVLGTAESTAEPRQPKRRGRPPGKRAKKAAGSAANAGQQPQTDAGASLKASEEEQQGASRRACSAEPSLIVGGVPGAATIADLSEPKGAGSLKEDTEGRGGPPKDNLDELRTRDSTTCSSSHNTDSAAPGTLKEEPVASRPDPAEDTAADEEAARLLSAITARSAEDCEEALVPPKEDSLDARLSPAAVDVGQAGAQHGPKVPGSGLGALAQALADASASKKPAHAPQLTPLKTDGSGEAPSSAALKLMSGSPRSYLRRRKRTLPPALPCILQTVDEASCDRSGSGKSQPGSSEGHLSAESPCTSNDDSDHIRPGKWRLAFKKKHRQRLKEIEAEEAAAASQELVSEEAFYELARSAQEPKRSMRPVRTPRAMMQEAPSDILAGRESKDVEGGSPAPARRGTRGRGRWANHVKRGNGRGLRPAQPPSPQDTLRASRPIGARGRRGGRWSNRASSRPDVEKESADPGIAEAAMQSDIRICAFGGIVDALERRAEGLPFAGFTPPQEVLRGLHPCHSILEVPEQRFLEHGRACGAHEQGWAFKSQLAPVPLFK